MYQFLGAPIAAHRSVVQRKSYETNTSTADFHEFRAWQLSQQFYHGYHLFFAAADVDVKINFVNCGVLLLTDERHLL